jgi:hypothetical protein
MIKCCGLGLALAAMLTTAAKADLVYNWVPAAGNGITSQGSITVNGSGDVTAISFKDGTYGTFTDIALSGTYELQTEVLSDGHLGVIGYVWDNSADIGHPLDKHIYLDIQFDINGNPMIGTEEINVEDNYNLQGDFVVPEPSTLMAGALLMLPFGASTLRIMRKKVVA